MLFKITADYRKNNPNKPTYYVLAKDKKSAKSRFSEYMSWMTIFSCEECDSDEKNHVLGDPCHHIIF